MKLQVLGTGCSKCEKLSKHVQQAATELGLDFEFEKVEDVNAIMAFGVMMVPALVVDGEVKLSGRVPSVEELKQILS